MKVIRDELDAMVLRRVVGCGQHHSTGEVHIFDRVGDDRRWGVAVNNIGWDAICAENVCDQSRKLLTEEACIVTDNDTLASLALTINMVGDGLCDEGNIVECKLAGHYCTPAICAKSYLFRCNHVFTIPLRAIFQNGAALRGRYDWFRLNYPPYLVQMTLI